MESAGSNRLESKWLCPNVISQNEVHRIRMNPYNNFDFVKLLIVKRGPRYMYSNTVLSSPPSTCLLLFRKSLQVSFMENFEIISGPPNTFSRGIARSTKKNGGYTRTRGDLTSCRSSTLRYLFRHSLAFIITLSLSLSLSSDSCHSDVPCVGHSFTNAPVKSLGDESCFTGWAWDKHRRFEMERILLSYANN